MKCAFITQLIYPASPVTRFIADLKLSIYNLPPLSRLETVFSVRANFFFIFLEVFRKLAFIPSRVFIQGRDYNWWKVDEMSSASGADGSVAIHDTVTLWSKSEEFNKSLSVSPLLSEADAHALHEHFVRVELSKIDEQILGLVEEIGAMGDEIADGPTWPVGIAPYSKPPNRYQVYLHTLFLILLKFLAQWLKFRACFCFTNRF